MGTEYRIAFAGPHEARVERLLERMPDIHVVSTPTPRFEFRTEASKTAMADASTQVTPYGLYFCDHGRGKRHLGVVIATLVAEFERVEVSALE